MSQTVHTTYSQVELDRAHAVLDAAGVPHDPSVATRIGRLLEPSSPQDARRLALATLSALAANPDPHVRLSAAERLLRAV